MSDGESIAGREREVTFHTAGALTREQFPLSDSDFDMAVRDAMTCNNDPRWHKYLVTHNAALRATIEQQAQELDRVRSGQGISSAEMDLTKQLSASQARCREMEREIESLTTCGCEGCDDNLEESAFCLPCMNKVQKQVTQLQATLAAREARIAELEAYKRSRDDYSTNLTDAELRDPEYMQAYCSDFFKDFSAELQSRVKAEAERDAAVQEAGRLREALSLLYDHQNGCPLPKYEPQWNEAMRLTGLALNPQQASGRSGGAANHGAGS